MAKTTGAPPKASYHHGGLREALLAAAEQELAEKGIEGFTLRGVAKRAGVSHAAPAHHFRDSAHLLTALAALSAERFHQAMKSQQAKAADDPRSQFIASGEGYVKFALGNPSLFELMFGSRRPDVMDDAFMKSASAAFMILVDGVADLYGADPLGDRVGRTDILVAWSLVHGLANLLIAGRLKFMESDLAADLDATVRGAIERVVPEIGRP